MPPTPPVRPASPLARLPFFYGWVVVAVAFVTMAIGVNVRTAFGLLYPPILTEFGWSRAQTAAAFTVGFTTSAFISPFLGYFMDRLGPRGVISGGAVVVSLGMALVTFTTQPWHLYLTLGVIVVGGTVIMTYTGHSMFLPLWFTRRRGMAIGLAFSGVGVGSMLLFPWVQSIIDTLGWRTACWAMVALLLAIVFPLNLLLQRRRPEDLGLLPDGAPQPEPGAAVTAAYRVSVVPWTVRRALRSAPFWWISTGYFSGLFCWYLVQVHQTKYLVDIGFSPTVAAYALGLVGLVGIVGQISVGSLADRIGPEWAWTVASVGYAICYALLLALQHYPEPALMYLMVAVQGLFGYGVASVYGTIPADIFRGAHYGTIFGLISFFATLGAGVGPWVGGLVQDWSGTYQIAFLIGLVLSLFSILCIWIAAPSRGPERGTPA